MEVEIGLGGEEGSIYSRGVRTTLGFSLLLVLIQWLLTEKGRSRLGEWVLRMSE